MYPSQALIGTPGDPLCLTCFSAKRRETLIRAVMWFLGIKEEAEVKLLAVCTAAGGSACSPLMTPPAFHPQLHFTQRVLLQAAIHSSNIILSEADNKSLKGRAKFSGTPVQSS